MTGFDAAVARRLKKGRKKLAYAFCDSKEVPTRFLTQKSLKTSILRFERGTNSIFDPKIVENIDFTVQKRYQLDFWPKNRRKHRFYGSREVRHHDAHIYPGPPCIKYQK